MTLQETERCRRQSARDKAMHYERRRSGGGDDAIRPDDNRVLTLAQWCALNGISLATGRRLINVGTGPVITQLSPRRIGVTVRDNRPWQASRARVASAMVLRKGNGRNPRVDGSARRADDRFGDDDRPLNKSYKTQTQVPTVAKHQPD